MGRASDAQKAEPLNRARTLLRDFDQLPDAVEQLAQDCSISLRQAVSLPPTSATVEGAADSQQTQAGVYGEMAAQFD